MGRPASGGPLQEDVNPATYEIEDKHFWLVSQDGPVFGSARRHDGSAG
jgi:hypothetical protein